MLYGQGCDPQISEAEAASDFAALMAEFAQAPRWSSTRHGGPLAVVRPIAEPSLRLLSNHFVSHARMRLPRRLMETSGRDLEEIVNQPSPNRSPARMGLILDSSVVIAAERSGKNRSNG